MFTVCDVSVHDAIKDHVPSKPVYSAVKGHPCPVRKHAEVNDLASFYLDLVHLRNSSPK